MIIVDRDLQVLYANDALGSALGDVPPRTASDTLEQAGFSVVRRDGSPWPLEERPVALAAQRGRSTRREVMGLVRGGRARWLRVSAWPLCRPGEPPHGAVGTYSDITDHERARVELEESEAHFRLLAHNSTDVITRHRVDGVCTYVSPAVTDLLGWDPERVLGRSPLDLAHPDDQARVVAEHDAVRADHVARTLRYRLWHRDGRWLWCESVVRPVLDDHGALHELQTSTRDITARVEAEERLERLALDDPLTGLANRTALTSRLEELVGQDRQLAVLFLDLDRFKVVNDSLGHSAGDQLLRTVAERLTGACRHGDVVARLGGDEFVVVAQDLDESGAVELAERVQQVLTAPVQVGDHELVLSASVGIVASPAGARPPACAETLLRDADVSMYRAKASGRARAVVWDERYGVAADTRLALERDLRGGLERRELVVHYQPQVELGSGRVVGVEALVRWQHPVRGLLAPDAFLDVAEESGLVVELGRQVLAAASRQLADWRRLPGCGGLRLSVNLSAQELVLPGRPEGLLAVLAEVGLPTSALTVEVLESVLLDPDGHVATALAAHRSTGLELALDDFGTGSSSLLHLRHLPVGAVKLDRTFVAGLGLSRHDEAIVRAVRAVTADLGLTCVAEGVEHERQRDWLIAHGVALGQGHLLARPLPAEAVTGLLRSAPPGRQDEPSRVACAP